MNGIQGLHNPPRHLAAAGADHKNKNQPAFGPTNLLYASDSPHTVLHMDALYSAGMRLPGGGWMNASVYRAEAWSADFPVMLVKGTNADGTNFTAEVNVHAIDARNASFVELFALDGHNNAMGKENGVSRAASHALKRLGLEEGLFKGTDAFAKFDFLPALRAMMDFQFQHRNWEGYGFYKNALDVLSAYRGF